VDTIKLFTNRISYFVVNIPNLGTALPLVVQYVISDLTEFWGRLSSQFVRLVSDSHFKKHGTTLKTSILHHEQL